MGKDEKLNAVILDIFAVTREMDEDFRALQDVDDALSKMRSSLASSLSNSMVGARYTQLWRQLERLERDVGDARRTLTEMGYFPQETEPPPIELEAE